MKNCQLLILIFLHISAVFHAQNLVPNPSFEEYTNSFCGIMTTVDFEQSFSEWNTPTFGTPDAYFTDINQECFNYQPDSEYPGPIGIKGSQEPRTGEVMLGIGCYTIEGLNQREYIQINLPTPLEIGQTYLVEFYASLADSVEFSTNKLGAYLSTNESYLTSNGVLNYGEQIEAADFISDTENWVLISGTILAEENYDYLTIGNFYSDSETSTAPNPTASFGIGTYGSYYFIDDVSVTLISESDPTVELPEPGSTYTYGVVNMGQPSPAEIFYWGEEVNINDTIYRTFGQTGDSGPFYIRQEEYTWLMRTPAGSDFSHSEIPLYDWSAEEGDTIEVGNPLAFGDDFISSIVIDSISLELDPQGNTRKHYYFTNITHPESNNSGQHWIEGIGTTIEFDYSAGTNIFDYGLQLVCAEINGDLVYEEPFGINYENCEWTTSVEEHVKSISVYPSPCEDRLNISSDLALQRLILKDIYGKEVIEKEPLSNSTSMNLSSLPAGIYFLKVVLKSGEEITQRILKI